MLRVRSSSKRLHSAVKRLTENGIGERCGQTKYRPCSVSRSEEQDGNRKATPVMFRKLTTPKKSRETETIVVWFWILEPSPPISRSPQ
ncbi:hypothetical protein K0M31_014409 [Melipona bicolor]|uniref:Uncharacterized protein n=1 Tax=Melipona bicolor TaxID=60889 RepID=A0AA40G8P8_9HYME|nr:hypothetical protein K0M31_014409 [Melipona bicolor]